MKKEKNKPFFCYVAHSSIHQPVMEYAPRILKYANKPEACNEMGNNPVIGAMMETLDKHVGRLLDTLDDLKLTEDTLVIFVGDNGDYFGREGLKPFYGSKGDLYEGGVRVPFLMQWPRVIPAGTECAETVCAIDFFPTFAEIAGVLTDDPEVDGVSLLPAMTCAAQRDRSAALSHYHALGMPLRLDS